jgi:hypothetical protein
MFSHRKEALPVNDILCMLRIPWISAYHISLFLLYILSIYSNILGCDFCGLKKTDICIAKPTSTFNCFYVTAFSKYIPSTLFIYLSFFSLIEFLEKMKKMLSMKPSAFVFRQSLSLSGWILKGIVETIGNFS